MKRHLSFQRGLLVTRWVVLILAVLSGCTTVPHSASLPYGPYSASSASGQYPFSVPHDIYHEVGPLETLWRISKTYGVDMDTLLKVNHLTDPAKIKAGQKLLIPKTLGPRAQIPLYPSRRWSYIVVHHTATHEGNAYSIDRLHHKRGFWNGLGYHFLIDNGTNGKVDGQIEVGPRWIKQMDGAHANADGMNERGIGIAVVGNFSENRLSEAQLQSLVFLVQQLQHYYRIPPQNVIGHREVRGKATECPGTQFPWSRFKTMIQ